MKEADRELLIRYFYGRCTPAEKDQAAQLLQNPEAEAFFRQLSQQEWDKPTMEDEKANAMYLQWKESLQARILSLDAAAHRNNSPVRWLKRLRYAAVWLVMLMGAGISLWMWKKGSQSQAMPMMEIANQQGMPVRYFLPDSSEVFLAASSTITYPKEFTGTTRTIELRGEAFFHVTSHPDRPFIVHSGSIDTRVLGTSFKVKAYEGQQQEVAVATGKVSVSAVQQEKATALALLTPGLKINYNPQTGKVIQETFDITDLEHWKNGGVVFDRVDMATIAHELQRRYGVTIVFADSVVKTHRVSGTFAPSKTIEQVMKTLALAGKFNYQKHAGTFIIHQNK